MTAYASISARRWNTDPAPYLDTHTGARLSTAEALMAPGVRLPFLYLPRDTYAPAQYNPVNPILDAFRDLDDPEDPWGDAMTQLGALQDARGLDLTDGAPVAGDLDGTLSYLLEALGFETVPPVDDNPYTWPTLREVRAVDPDTRQAYLDHAERVTDRRETFARMCGLDY